MSIIKKNLKRKIAEIEHDLESAPNMFNDLKRFKETPDETIELEPIEDKECQSIINNIFKIYDTKDQKIVENFNKTVLFISDYKNAKDKDLMFRVNAKQSMLDKFESQFADPHQHIYDGEPSKYEYVFKDKTKEEIDEIYNLLDKLIIKFRKYKCKEISSDDYHWKYQEHIEVAIKSNKSHKTYTEIICKLFENIFVNNISNIISDYSRNSYRWYSLKCVWEVNNTDGGFCTHEMCNVPFSFYDDYDDKINDEKFYRSKSNKIKFDELRNDLNVSELNSMNDLDMSYFLTSIANSCFNIEFDLCGWGYKSRFSYVDNTAQAFKNLYV
eukprot:471886_1